MLKVCPASTNTNIFLDTKCGEIRCEREDSFSIICCFCDEKLKEFDKFLFHFKNNHVNPLKDEDVLEVQVKEEENNKCDLEIFNTRSPGQNFIYENENSTSNDDTYEQAANGIPIKVFVEARNNSHLNLEENEDCHATNDCKSLCEFKFNNKDVLETETSTINHTCEHCGKNYTKLYQLKNHIKLKHAKSKVFECDQCADIFSENRSLQAHIRKVHTGYPCPACNKVYKTSDSLKVHSFTHKAVKDFICDFENCGKAFVSRKRLNIHRKVHTGLRNYICEICGYRTRVKDSLKIHVRTHTGEKPYVCQICNKCFISSSMLNEHKAVHSTERPHKCTVCGATFTARKALYHHRHLHSGIKKFKCKICGNAYAQAAGLSGHMRSHKKDGLF